MVAQSQSGTTGKGNLLKSLILPAIRNFVIGVMVLGAVLCFLAGTFNYWQGWVFTILFAFLTTAQGIYLGIKDPELLERRKNVAPEGESKAERIFIIVGLLSMLCLFVFSALDHRFGWSTLPTSVTVVGDALPAIIFITGLLRVSAP